MKKTISVLLVLTFVLFALASCKNNEKTDQSVTNHAEIEFEGFGTVTVELYGNSAPVTVENFVKLAKSGYYDGTKIIRVQKSFVIQGGQGDGTSTIKGEFSNNGVNTGLVHKRGTLSMARQTANDTASDRFFICLDDESAKSLDGNYAAFGNVIKGMDVIDALASSIKDYSLAIENGQYVIKDFGDYDQSSYGINYGFLASAKYITINSIKITD